MIVEEVTENQRTATESESAQRNKVPIENAVNFLLRSHYSGIFYRVGTTAYLIPAQYNLGYKVAPLRVN